MSKFRDQVSKQFLSNVWVNLDARYEFRVYPDFVRFFSPKQVFLFLPVQSPSRGDCVSLTQISVTDLKADAGVSQSKKSLLGPKAQF